MSEQDKRPYATNDNRVRQLGFHKEDEKKFEIVYKPYTPFGNIGHWLQFIWRF